jgi:preprotein translocase subunit YajC
VFQLLSLLLLIIVGILTYLIIFKYRPNERQQKQKIILLQRNQVAESLIAEGEETKDAQIDGLVAQREFYIKVITDAKDMLIRLTVTREERINYNSIYNLLEKYSSKKDAE